MWHRLGGLAAALFLFGVTTMASADTAIPTNASARLVRANGGVIDDKTFVRPLGLATGWGVWGMIGPPCQKRAKWLD